MENYARMTRKEAEKQLNKFKETIDEARNAVTYAGARNDGSTYRDDYFLAVLEGLRELKEYIAALNDEIESLEAENDSLQAEVAAKN